MMNKEYNPPTEEDLIKLLENIFPFINRMGLKILHLQDGNIRVLLPLRGNENHIGTMYAGALFSLAEFVIGPIYYAFFDTSRFYPLVKEMCISYCRPAKTDVSVELQVAEGEMQHIAEEARRNKKCDFTLTTDIKDSFGRVVATTIGKYQMRYTYHDAAILTGDV